LPPLRERRGDIELTARHFVKSLPAPVASKSISPAAVRKLVNYDWPGNVRELFNHLQRAVVLSGGAAINPTIPHYAPDLGEPSEPMTRIQRARHRMIESFEQRFVTDILRKHSRHVTHAAKRRVKIVVTSFGHKEIRNQARSPLMERTSALGFFNRVPKGADFSYPKAPCFFEAERCAKNFRKIEMQFNAHWEKLLR